MSKNKSQQNVPTLSPIANAMYNAQKKELTSSIVTSLAFLAVGGLVTAFSIVKYFSVSRAIQDPSEQVDAIAWLVIAGIGVGVVAIGIVNMLKSLASLGQLSSLLKRTESHASPFQDQQLSKRVAQMNQSQAMKNAEIVSAEQLKQEGKKGTGLFGRKKLSSSELYDKYNPQKKQNQSAQRITAPPKAKPMMEQKFDYGIHEEKELTFADEFLMKNKRDPFAQYRKELGIKEEAPKFYEQKPQFVNTNSANKASTVQGGNGSSFELNLKNIGSGASSGKGAENSGSSLLSELDFSGKFDDNPVTAPIVQKPAEQPKQKSLLSQLDFGGSFGEDTAVQSTTETTANTQSKPRSLLSELDFGGNFGESTAPTASKPEATSTQSKPRSLLSELDLGGNFGESTAPAASQPETTSTQPKPRSLLSELDFGGNFGESTASAASKPEATSTQSKPRSLLSELDFGGNFGESTVSAASKPETTSTQPKPRSLLSELDFGGNFGENTAQTASQPETTSTPPKPRSLLSELDFGGNFGDDNTPVQPSSVKPVTVKPADVKPVTAQSSTVSQKVEVKQSPSVDPVAARASVKMISFLSDKSGDSFAEITGVEKIDNSQSVGSSSPYGMHREEDDGMFFAPRSNNTGFTQHQTRAQKPESYDLNNFAPDQPHGNQKPAAASKNEDFTSDIVKNGTPAQRKYVEASEFDEWTCPQCGKVNQEYVGVCACGRRKPRKRF